MRQITDWGYIDWEYLPNTEKKGRWFNFGKVTILPGRKQPLHIHYGNEQFLYVVSGKAEVRFNGIEHHLKPGDYFLLDADTTHESYNPGPEPYVEYMVANPLPSTKEQARIINQPVTSAQVDEQQAERDRVKLNLAAENLKTTILKDISVHVCLADINNNIVLRNEKYPDYCLAKCDPASSPKQCDCYCHEYISHKQRFTEQPSPYVCKYGMQLFWYPVFLNGRIIGTLRGGRHYTSQNTNSGFDPTVSDYYDTPYSTQYSIARVIKSIAESITSYCGTLEEFEELTRQKMELNSYIQRTDELARSLSDIEETVTNLKIDHHFLFNTLNCLANMSLTGDRMDLYKSVIDLSRMFRYTMTQDKQATLGEELAYLRSYLDLQKLRWRDGLIIEYNIDSDAENQTVPFNFLQPIAENAFTHAFLTYEGVKHIWVDVLRITDCIEIKISNNGDPPLRDDIERISISWASGSGHGLSFIYEKLKAYYGDNFSLSINVTDEGLTAVSVRIPV